MHVLSLSLFGPCSNTLTQNAHAPLRRRRRGGFARQRATRQRNATARAYTTTRTRRFIIISEWRCAANAFRLGAVRSGAAATCATCELYQWSSARSTHAVNRETTRRARRLCAVRRDRIVRDEHMRANTTEHARVHTHTSATCCARATVNSLCMH